MNDRPSFFDELKRRKVPRVAIVYLAVAWAVVQVADVFVPALGLPETILSAVAVLSILGFPVAVALAWAFDAGSGGVVRTAGAVEGEPRHGWVSGRTVAVAVVLLAVGWLAGRAGRAPSAGSETDGPPRVAVLPFRDLGASDDATNFAAGMHDDILTQLSRIAALRVTSRTSVERYAGTEKTIQTIAAELGVNAVLEGGIQRSSSRVRINMQLIDGRTDEHLWADTYDRELTAENVFAIQSEIARAVAAALSAALDPDEESALDEVPTHDLAALELYHRGRRELDLQGNRAPSTRAIGLLQSAVELDSTFVAAWYELARGRSWAIREGMLLDTLEAWGAVERTRALAPGSVEATLAEGVYRYYARADLTGAREAFERARAMAPGDVDVTFHIANIARRLGRWEEAAALYRTVAEEERGNPRAWMDLAWTLRALRRFDEARRAIATAAEIDPAFGTPTEIEADILLWGVGDTATARAVIEDRGRPFDPGLREAGVAALAYVHRAPGAYAAMPELRRRGGGSFDIYTIIGSGGEAFTRATTAWALGNRELGRTLVPEIRDQLAALFPGGLEATLPVADDRDFFAWRGSVLITRAWIALFEGRPEEARTLADRAVASTAGESDRISWTVIQRERARLRVAAGDPDGAVADLTELLGRPGSTTVAELRLDPMYDPLRDRADFRALVGG